MNGNDDRIKPLDGLAEFSDFDAFTVPSTEVSKDSFRLEAAFYGSDGYRAVQALTRSDFPLVRLGDLAQVAQPPIFKRCHVFDAEFGVPYLNGALLMEARPRPDSFLSKSQTGVLQSLLIRTGMVLFLDAGQNAGEAVIYVTDDLNGVATTNNTIRLLPKASTMPAGFLYSYLSSNLGQYLLTRHKYGSSIPHIEPKQVENLIVPRFPVALNARIGDLIARSMDLRVDANRLLGDASRNVQHSCYLDDIETFQRRKGSDSVHSFVSHSKECFPASSRYGETRFDVPFHSDEAQAARRHILSKPNGTELGNLLASIRNSALRKRHYVDDSGLGVSAVGWNPDDANAALRSEVPIAINDSKSR